MRSGFVTGSIVAVTVSSARKKSPTLLPPQSGIGIAEVLVIVEMVFTITKSTFALAAVSEFECRVGLVGRTTDDAFVPRVSRVGANLSLLLNSSAFRP
jgi:hypothetical protein